MKGKSSMKILGTLVSAALLLLAGTLPLAAQVSGAIFTTTASGTMVNGNIYDNKSDVYLDGGPQNANCTSAGLTDGDYYFQVTDPSGGVLLSTDAASNRVVTVSGGVFSSYSGTHATSTGPCSSSTVQLLPYDDTPNQGGEYKVWAIAVGAATVGEDGVSLVFSSSDAKTDNFKVRASVTFPPTDITGIKFYDTNTNGVHDAGEPTIPGWRIEMSSSTVSGLTYTSSSGQYSFMVNQADPGPFTISEVIANPSWLPTTPTSGTVPAGVGTGPNFGNVCLGAGGGLTLGFWSNKNGQKFFQLDDLALMVALNLRNADGSAFNPASYAAFRTWLLNATATNMAYMLSAQLATMELNVLNGFVNSGGYIYAPGTNSANAAGFATVATVMTEANTALSAKGLVLSGDPDRTRYEALKNALDSANNNRTFVQSGPCAFTTPY